MSEGADLSTGLQRRWLVANAISMLVVAACGFAGYFLRVALEIEGASSGSGVGAAYLAAETILLIVSFVVYARLSAGVLRTILPVLPWRSWIAAHAALGLVLGPLVGLIAALPRDAEPFDWSDKLLATFFFVAIAIGGAALGAALGAVQALILRKVAEGTGVWIRISALSTCVVATLALSAQVILPQYDAFLAAIIDETTALFASMAGAVIMLHALANLRPKIG